MASKFIPSGYNTPLAKSTGNNSKTVNKRGKFTRTVMRQRLPIVDENGKLVRYQMIFHKLRRRTDAERLMEIFK
jgi:hypothetical protein